MQLHNSKMPTSTTTANIDANQIHWTLLQLIRLPALDINDAPLKHTLNNAAVIGFNSDFIGLSTADIMSLKVPATNTKPAAPVPLAQCCKLIMALAFYHDVCCKKGGAINITLTNKTLFDLFCTGEHNPDDKIIPWNVDIPTEESKAMETWR